MRIQIFFEQIRRGGGLLGRALERLQQSSDLDLAATLRDGLVALASGASVRELADLLEVALEDAFDWRELIPGPIGQLIERAEDVPLRLAALQLARKLTAQWQKLDDAGRLSWLESLLPVRA